jgi:hypothetical protein
MSMKKSHEHGEPHAHMTESAESISASPSFFVTFVTPSASSDQLELVLDIRGWDPTQIETKVAQYKDELTQLWTAFKSNVFDTDRWSKVNIYIPKSKF